MQQKVEQIKFLIITIFIAAGIFLMITIESQEKEVEPQVAIDSLSKANEIHLISVLDGAKSDEHRRAIMNCNIDFAGALGFSNRRIEPFAYENNYCYAYVDETQQILSIRECEALHVVNGIFSIYIYPSLSGQEKNTFFKNKMYIYIPEGHNESCAKIAETT